MSLKNLALAKTDDLPIKHEGDVHSGKVRSVYWLTKEDSERLISEQGYPIFPQAQLGAMIITDKISAFECNWKGEDGLEGVPGKGAALNVVSEYFFKRFSKQGLAENHLIDTPHPLVWIVQKAEPIMVEAIAREYITGSMWRAYKKGEREFCGIELPDGLEKDQKLDKILITPSTKGILRGIAGVAEDDDVNITRKQIIDNYQSFGFKSQGDVAKYEDLLLKAFSSASSWLEYVGQILVDTKLEMGYLRDSNGCLEMGYIDEPLTPDSSRIWDTMSYNRDEIVETSKEGFRQFLLKKSGLNDKILLDKARMEERKQLAKDYRVPVEEFMKVSKNYADLAETIAREKVPKIENAREEILDTLLEYKLVMR